ncbi:hypothetical protein RvY_09775 [Ramazzottius varieornatus]|uniref:Uncharacterized protein n=1 Tax=Ramazzottius varieornatus TaxID=947166 RepID=A0A1D1VAJ5_RAMVA|nr:hypothetical protein RvY_09775 [Ramazzottius varieornatus]
MDGPGTTKETSHPILWPYCMRKDAASSRNLTLGSRNLLIPTEAPQFALIANRFAVPV